MPIRPNFPKTTFISNKISQKFYVFAGLLLCTSLGLGAFAAHAGVDKAIAIGLEPHKALYDVRLSAKKSSAKIANISGKMFYEWQPACDAWVSKHHFDMTYEYVEVPSVRITSNFSTYESFDGKEFNFTSLRKRGDVVLEEIRGNVASDGTDYPNEARFSLPEDLVFTLPEGALFPMAHTIDVIEKIKKGTKFYNAVMFDGSDDEGPVDINNIIGKKATFVPDEEYKEFIDEDLIKSQAWNLRLAFFPLKNPEAAADYEMSAIFHENGVISDMTIDYDEFSVTQKLVAIEPLEGTCNQ